jgi:hypothetical protein
MPELRTNPSALRSRDLSSREEPISIAERELVAFVDMASQLVGPGSRGLLTEIWLDELACMECMPEPSSPDWRLVTEAAERRLAKHLRDMGLSELPVGRAERSLVRSRPSVASRGEEKPGVRDFSCIFLVSAVIY